MADDNKSLPSKKDDIGEREVQARFDEETAQGFRGVRTDPTPLEHYTVPGVVKGKPTPETDEKAAERAVQHQQQL